MRGPLNCLFCGCAPGAVDHLEDTEFNPMLNSRFNRRGYGEELVGKRITVYCTEWENW